jgi:hypothetical protein
VQRPAAGEAGAGARRGAHPGVMTRTRLVTGAGRRPTVLAETLW